jgi:hypothetical protein
MSETFAQTVRMMWIDAVIDEDGEIGRSDITRAFGVSMPQASADIRRYMARNPRRIAYDPSLKRYLMIEGTNPIFMRDARNAAVEMVNAVQSIPTKAP